MLEVTKGANLALRFLLELCALVALGYWGFKTGSGTIAKIALGIGAPLVAAVAWAFSWRLGRRLLCPGSWSCFFR